MSEQTRLSPAVTAIAVVFLLVSLVAVAALLGARHGAAAWLPPGDGQAGGLDAGLAWLARSQAWLTWLLMSAALATFALSVALLLRRPWARRAFIALTGVGFIAVCGAVALTPLVFTLAPDAAIARQVNPEQPLTGLVGLLGTLVLLGTALAVLFGWAAWVLSSQSVRAEFDAIPAIKES